jgi:TetR/AcrR family transcriptional regulator
MHATATRTVSSTPDRIVAAALDRFATAGFEATSLDRLAEGLGVRKQTVLHHFTSKDGLLDAVMTHAASVVSETVEAALVRPGEPWERLERVVHAVFALAARRPEYVGFLREVARLGPERLERLAAVLDPLTARAADFLALHRGDRSGTDPVSEPGRDAAARAVVISAYAAVLAYATEADVLRRLGQVPPPRLFLRRRRELLDYLAEQLSMVSPKRGPR